MEKNMRDFDKIREDFEFHLDNKQIRMLIMGAVTMSLLVFVLGFLVGRHFPPKTLSQQYALMSASGLDPADRKPAGEDRPLGVGFEFFEELSDEDPNASPPVQKSAPGKGVKTSSPPSKSAAESRLAASDLDEKTEKDKVKVEEKKTQAAEVPEPPDRRVPKTIPNQYTVQVGAFEDEAGAEKLTGKLKEKQYPSYILMKTIQGKGTWHRVRVGRYATRTEAEEVAKRLEEREGLLTFITLYARN